MTPARIHALRVQLESDWVVESAFKADATFICRAVTYHGQLVAAVKFLNAAYVELAEMTLGVAGLDFQQKRAAVEETLSRIEGR